MPKIINSRSIKRRRNSRSEHGRRMARIRWDRENACRDALARATAARWAEFEVVVRHKPTGKAVVLEFVPWLGGEITKAAEGLDGWL